MELLDIERAAVRAVPALEEVRVHEWLVAFGRGAVQRMNAVTTFGTAPDPLEEAVDQVEALADERGAARRFRLTRLDADLDALLHLRGYQRSVDVLVMTRPLQRDEPDAAAAFPQQPGGPPAHGRADPEAFVRGASDAFARDAPEAFARGVPDAAWLDGLRRFGGYDEARAAEIGAGLARLRLPHAAFRREAAAVGLAVVDGGWLGLFDIAVAPERRRSGLARALTAAMLAWGAAEGATGAYLQVHSENAPALALYRGLGFDEAYRYHYRAQRRG